MRSIGDTTFVLRLFFAISILAVLLYKISEPMVAGLRFASAVEKPLPKITASDEQIEIKIYAPLPYGVNWEEVDPIQKSFKKGDAFFNMVERRYVNDTLYFTLQRNLNAHDEFDALSSIVNALISDDQQQQQSSHHTTTSAEDFMKVFPPSTPPALVLCQHRRPLDLRANAWHYVFSLPTRFLTIVAPPPDRLVIG